jgi:hypothetical protein
MNAQTLQQTRWDARIEEKEHLLRFMLGTVHMDPSLSGIELLREVVYHCHPDDDIPQDLIDEIDREAIPHIRATIEELQDDADYWSQLPGVDEEEIDEIYAEINHLKARLVELGEEP